MDLNKDDNIAAEDVESKDSSPSGATTSDEEKGSSMKSNNKGSGVGGGGVSTTKIVLLSVLVGVLLCAVVVLPVYFMNNNNDDEQQDKSAAIVNNTTITTTVNTTMSDDDTTATVTVNTTIPGGGANSTTPVNTTTPGVDNDEDDIDVGDDVQSETNDDNNNNNVTTIVVNTTIPTSAANSTIPGSGGANSTTSVDDIIEDGDDDDSTETNDNNVTTTTIVNNTTTTPENTTTTAPVNTTTEEQNDNVMTTGSNNGPFNATLNLFGPAITQGYSSANSEQLDEDLWSASWYLLNEVVLQNTGDINVYNRFPGSADQESADVTIDAPVALPVADEGADTSVGTDAGGTTSTTTTDDLNDFGTNNQEDDVEEGDLIVSDGERVYAAYGEYLVAWWADTGEMLTSVRMPLIPEQQRKSVQPPDDFADVDFMPVMDLPSFYYGPTSANIQSLLLYEQRLVCIVNGYGPSMQSNLTYSPPVLDGYQSTHVRVYDISALTQATPGSTIDEENAMELIGTRDINGQFVAIRAINSKTHIVTNSNIETWTYLRHPFDRWQFPAELDDDEYITRVQEDAETIHIPKFVNRLLDEITVNGTIDVDLAQISLWQSNVSNTTLYTDGVLKTFTQVTSFDLLADGIVDEDNDDPQLDISVSGAFMPSSWAQVYAASNSLIIAGQGWDINQTTGWGYESTYLLGMELNNDQDGLTASSTPHSVGQLLGYVLNSYSIDVVGNILRIATTVQHNWLRGFPIAIEEDMVFVDVDENEASSTSSDAFTSLEEEEEPSRTENYVIILEMPGPDGDNAGVMEELGRVKLGKPNELFTAVRFFDNIAYAVTFEQRDPLYVLNLDNLTNPEIIGELDITGFSSYLHSMNENNTLLLAIGQEATDEGVQLGVKINVFDARVPSELKSIQNYTIEQEQDVYSYTDVQWDFKAVRYAGDYLIMPLYINSYTDASKNFRGFETYFVNENIIDQRCRIHHDDTAGEDFCYACGSHLPKRSMIFGGNVMTTDEAFVRSTDLDTCDNVWDLDIVVGDGNEARCCNYYWF